MKNWKVWTAFLTVFATGIIVGAVSFGLVLQHHLGKPRDRAAFRATMQERIMDDILDTVRPDTSAIPAIREAVAQTMNELEAIRAETHPRIKAVFEQGKARITAHLTPEQAARFDKMVETRRKGKFDFFKLPPPPPPLP